VRLGFGSCGGFGRRSGAGALARFRILFRSGCGCGCGRRLLEYIGRLLTGRSNRYFMFRGPYSFGFCSRGSFEFGGLGNRFDSSGSSGVGCRLLRNNLTLSLRGVRSPLLYWRRTIDTSSIHVRRSS
jgi:hypothetical protein